MKKVKPRWAAKFTYENSCVAGYIFRNELESGFLGFSSPEKAMKAEAARFGYKLEDMLENGGYAPEDENRKGQKLVTVNLADYSQEPDGCWYQSSETKYEDVEYKKEDIRVVVQWDGEEWRMKGYKSHTLVSEGHYLRKRTAERQAKQVFRFLCGNHDVYVVAKRDDGLKAHLRLEGDEKFFVYIAKDGQLPAATRWFRDEKKAHKWATNYISGIEEEYIDNGYYGE